MIDDGPPKLDQEQAFLLYSTFAGDVERTAHALGIPATVVIDMAAAKGWNDKLRAILALKRSAAPGDVERGLNRAMNFVQAHRMRLFLDRLLLKLSIMDNQELEDYFFTGAETKMALKPRTLTTRALADLASAIEKCHAATYQALSDTSSDRAGRDEGDNTAESSGAIHVAIAKAMSDLGTEISARSLLADAQYVAAQQIAGRQIEDRPGNPHDSDDH